MDREDRKNAIPAASKKITSAGQIFGMVPGDAHSTAARMAATSARQIKAGRQERLTRNAGLLLFLG